MRPMNEPVLIDSITEVKPEHAGRIVVTGSHGGRSVAVYAARVRAGLYVFNDAGVGRDRAGIAALDLLDNEGIAAVTVEHTSARIGEAADTLQRGVVSYLNQAAKELGVRKGHWVTQLCRTLERV